MFNFFKSRQEHVEELMDAIKENATVTPTPEPDRTSEPAYQIGKTEDNRTTLRIGGSGYFSILTMSDHGVRQLIRMLESTLEKETENETV
jgi:hypothetical protein